MCTNLIARRDYWLARWAIRQRWILWQLGNVESRLYETQLRSQAIDRPIFICGLARCGSTMLLELLARQPGIATHRYRDFPFVTIPIWWNRFLDKTSPEVAPRPRAHGDLIQITPHSPEGMEEILWDRYGGQGEALLMPRFQQFYTEHIRKLLWLRRGSRYVSKNNYHWQRLEQLGQLFSNAQFVIPVRHPVSHVESLAGQHSRFCKLAAYDQRVGAMLSAAGHDEFGPQRTARGLDPIAKQAVERLWAAGDDLGGYAKLWSEVYGRMERWMRAVEDPARVTTVQYEAFCEQPQINWAALTGALDLPQTHEQLDHVVPPAACRLAEEEQDRVWQATSEVAERFGYSWR